MLICWHMNKHNAWSQCSKSYSASTSLVHSKAKEMQNNFLELCVHLRVYKIHLSILLPNRSATFHFVLILLLCVKPKPNSLYYNHDSQFPFSFIITQKLYDCDLSRCTLSYPNWVFVFMASVNYTSRCHQDAMALFWTVSYVMNSAEGTDGKQYHECPLVNKEGKMKNTDNLYQSSDFNGEACKTQPSHLPWDHLHLYLYFMFAQNKNISLPQIAGARSTSLSAISRHSNAIVTGNSPFAAFFFNKSTSGSTAFRKFSNWSSIGITHSKLFTWMSSIYSLKSKNYMYSQYTRHFYE